LQNNFFLLQFENFGCKSSKSRQHIFTSHICFLNFDDFRSKFSTFATKNYLATGLMTNYFLQGEKVIFRPYNSDDIGHIHQWFNDPEVTHYMFTGQKPTTLEETKEIIAKTLESKENVLFMVATKENHKLIGLAGLYEIDATSRKAEMRIIIGDKDSWGKGYGTETVQLVNYYGFDRLNLNRIYLGVTDENRGAVRVYEKAGYQTEGVLKQDIYRNSRYYNSVRMAILRDYYYQNIYQKDRERFSIKDEQGE
jgi:RimJ/RimL family protein N-acetyltransferase